MGLEPGYATLLKTAISDKKGRDQTKSGETGSNQWVLLPGLCCQAAGGEACWADEAAAVWWLFYAAADLMDAVQDNDPPEYWWVDIGPGAALSAATGLFFNASSLLQKVARSAQTITVGAALIDDFHKSLLSMSAGQYTDLTHPQPALKKYWEIVSAKSGSFFSLACRSGARLSRQDQVQLPIYGEFGRTLGVLVQVLDDLEDLNLLQHPLKTKDLKKIGRSLPVVFAKDVISEPQHLQLMQNLALAEKDPDLGNEIFNYLEQIGAVFFLITEIKRLREHALESLAASGASGQARDMLEVMVKKLGVIPSA